MKLINKRYVDYVGKVYDIEVDTKDHSYSVNGAVVHNSAAGSLVTHMLGISKVDPIKWGLLFERFLSVDRIKKSLPDIDLDFLPSRREEVKDRLMNKYGANQFCRIGTYTTLQLKGAIKELSKLEGIEFSKINYLTSILDFEDDPSGTLEDLFKNACKKPQLKEFIQENTNLVNDLRLILNSPKSNSVHACATLIVPDDKEIFDWIPCRWGEKDGERILISEWEGEEIADSGFLKNDILGIEQLDKYKFCLDLIKQTTGKEIDIYNLPVDDENVLDYFRKGLNSDIFQFGSRGLTAYCKELQPYSIDELIDATALYRPGAMDVNSHNEYIFRKFGKTEVVYRWGLEEITKPTKGLIVYQEQVMQAFVAVGGFNMVEADDVRKAIVKKRKELIDSYKERFFEGAKSKGCPENEIAEIWHEIEVHGGYSFNKSHAASYTLISWVGQWLKFYYPVQFWTTALQFAKDEVEVAKYINEISKIEHIKVLSPNINSSGEQFETNFEKSEIYWSLSKIKFCGDVAVKSIIEERNTNGEYFSFKEFIQRMNPIKSKVNKRIIINLIISGAFDSVEDIVSPNKRQHLISAYYKLTGTKRDKEDEFLTSSNLDKDWWWSVKQKSITGFGVINYRSLVNKSELLTDYSSLFIESSDFFNEENENRDVVIGGIISKLTVRANKKGEYCHIEIDSNNENINCTIWSEQFEQYKNYLTEAEGKLCLIKGQCKFDNFRKAQAIQSSEKFLLEILT